MTNEAQMIRVGANMAELIKAGVAELQARGWTEDRIRPHLPFLAEEALAFLRRRAAH